MLEAQMQALRELPAQVAGVESEIVRLRHEMQEAFSATRSEFGGKMDGLDGRMDGLRTEMHGIRDELRTGTHGIRDELRAEIRIGYQALKDFMMMFEHHKSDLRTIGEGTPRKGRKR